MDASASAQDTPATPDTTSPSESREAGLEDIVVTAQKRAEPLQEVPVSVTAVSAETLDDFGVLNTDDLNFVAPALNTQRFGSFSLPVMRGITTTNTQVGAETNVATYIDGVYRPAIFSQLSDFTSIERVEVLKGPQGTLFGRNATGGAVNIITRSPRTDDVSGDFTFSYGRFNEMIGTAYLNVPITSKAAFNVAAVGIHRDGYIRNIFLNRNVGSLNDIAFRAKLLLQPTDTARFTLTAEYADQRDLVGSASYAIGGNIAAKLVAAQNGLPPTIFGPEYRTTGLSIQNNQSIKTYGTALEAEFNFRGVDLISISNVLFAGIDSRLDIDQSSTLYLDFDFGPKNLSAGEDLRLQSSGNGPLTWSVGVNFFYSKHYLKPQIVYILPFNLVRKTIARSSTSAVAFYGQAAYEFTPNLTLTAGARMNFEKKVAEFEGPNVGVPLTRVKKSWKNFSPRVAIDYKINPDTMVYASYSRGWKSGLFNPTTFSTTPAGPETLDAFELGVKSDINRTIRANVAGFYYLYNDIQVSSFSGQIIGTIVQNAASAHLYGIDADINTVFDDVFTEQDVLRITGGAVWTHARYREFPGAVRQIPIVDPILGLVGNRPVSVDAEGKHLPQAPGLALSGNLTYEMETNSGTWSLNANAYYNSGWFADSFNTPEYRQDSYVKLGGSLGWESPNGTYEVSLWVHNLTDVKTHSTITPNANGTFTASLLPRTFGIKAGYHF